jgi:DHA1 family bicyclomycin/chloramphenicol resistance-like MFS transporter
MTDQTLIALNTAEPDAASTGLQIAVLAALSSIGTLAINILLPSLPQMAASLRVRTPAVTASITVFSLLFALGQLLVGPISDRYGRRTPVLAGFAVFIVGSVWCGLAQDLQQCWSVAQYKRPVPVRLRYYRARSPATFLLGRR